MFLLLSPDAILIAAAVIPAIALLIYVYRQDKIEKEPLPLLISLVVYGIAATTIAKLLERAGMLLLDAVLEPGSLPSQLILFFVVVAYAEEGAKYALLKRRTWNDPDFNCRFDGVVYAVFVSLGFALWENIAYVFMYGLGTALLRAVTAIPGHACFGVLMGCWYGQARLQANLRDRTGSRLLLAMAVIVPALLHGAYDFLASLTEYYSSWYFILFVAALFLLTWRLVHRMSQRDRFV